MKPRVSIVIPLFNDADHVEAAITSCLSQTLEEIEVITVDDASTDQTAAVVERLQRTDARVRLVRQPTNMTAFQARRVGIEAARSPFVLFLDGDDELEPNAAETALRCATSEDADVVSFGCTVVKRDGTTGGAFERAMQPTHEELSGEDIATSLFPVGAVAQGQLWRYLFSRELLVGVYDSLPADLQLPRANDLPLAFLALTRARKLVSTPTRLYRYFFGRGLSGHAITSLEQFDFICSAIDSIDAISSAVDREASRRNDPLALRRTYASVRLSIVGRVLEAVLGIADRELQLTSLRKLRDRVGHDTTVMAAADFCPRALVALAAIAPHPQLGDRDPKHVVIRATNLGTGGAQGVVAAQAGHLSRAGFRVTIAIESRPDSEFALPDGVVVFRILGDTFSERIENFGEYCDDEDVDVIIDHYVFYNERWPFYALVAAGRDIPTVGWLHNFALRPIVDGSTRLSYLDQHLGLLSTVVVLSMADVAYWKLRGFPRVVYLPNPPSPLLDNLIPLSEPRSAPDGAIELVWWGRLQQSTKQVREIVEIAALLAEMNVDVRVKIIGPDGPDLKSADLAALARERGLGSAIELVGPLHGARLIDAASKAHLFVSTSIIEGYPLALVEAQAMGLPIVMYELPWLATAKGNEGMIQVPQGDRLAAAERIAELAADADLYRSRSVGSTRAAIRATSHDYDVLYADLVRGELTPQESETPGAEETRVLLHQNVLFLERLILRERRAIARTKEERNRAVRGLNRTRDALEAAEQENARLRARLEALLAVSPEPLKSTLPKTTPPSVPRSGFRRLLGRLLPASVHQASFFARHQYNVTVKQHATILDNQAALSEQVAALHTLVLSSSAIDDRESR